MKVLIIEDDPTLGEFLVRVVAEEGDTPELAVDMTTGLARARSASNDVIILDWMLPDGDGPTFCDQLRRAGVLTPILMLTARGEVGDRVTGLQSGADDYLVKPFEVEELLARLNALVRRSAQLAELRVGELVIDRLRRRCTLDGNVLDLRSREYELLLRLAIARSEPVSRATLLADVWNLGFDPGSGILDVHVSRLRDKLGTDAWRIETVRGVGYRLRERRDET
ncbi:response regulator transcription factor [Pendulispora brunnea]|uniref:Response regulator transcription factor n=1 Tax=Pendulispora brunnea TaxID=2905690 RepID=A0ABZ2KB80_9BACT